LYCSVGGPIPNTLKITYCSFPEFFFAYENASFKNAGITIFDPIELVF
jgi:hypothetical protein